MNKSYFLCVFCFKYIELCDNLIFKNSREEFTLSVPSSRLSGLSRYFNIFSLPAGMSQLYQDKNIVNCPDCRFKILVADADDDI